MHWKTTIVKGVNLIEENLIRGHTSAVGNVLRSRCQTRRVRWNIYCRRPLRKYDSQKWPMCFLTLMERLGQCSANWTNQWWNKKKEIIGNGNQIDYLQMFRKNIVQKMTTGYGKFLPHTDCIRYITIFLISKSNIYHVCCILPMQWSTKRVAQEMSTIPCVM